MWTRFFAIAVVGVMSVVTLGAQSTMNQVRLTEGTDEVNRLSDPVYDASQVPALTVGAFTPAYDKKALFVRRGGGNMFTRGPEYKLDPKVDIAALFTEAVGMQAAAMGFKVATSGASGWRLTGTVRDVYLESRQIPYGATLFFSYLDVEVQIESSAGAKTTMPMRLHNYFGAYNAGLGRKDEAESAAAHLLIEGAQELVARVNSGRIKAPPQASMSAKLATIQAGVISTQRPALRAVGLSGLQAAAPALLARLPKEMDESARAAIIDALAILNSPEIVATLASRYATEAEDCRWYTLKAMDYIGTDEAMKLVSTAGVADKDLGPKRLAQRITGKK